MMKRKRKPRWSTKPYIPRNEWRLVYKDEPGCIVGSCMAGPREYDPPLYAGYSYEYGLAGPVIGFVLFVFVLLVVFAW